MSGLSPRPLQPTLVPTLNALLAALAIPFAVEHPADLTPSLLLALFESIIAARLPIPLAIRQSRTRDAKSRAMLVLLGVVECDILRGGASPDDSALTGAGGVSVDGWADDIGLGEVDPERLADGGWEETIFIGELLCWLARRKGILPRTKPSTAHPRSLYSNHHSYGDDSADLSTSLLLRPSPTHKASSSPIADVDPDMSMLSHITDVPRHPLVHSPEPSLSLSATTGTDLSIRARSVSSRTSVSNAHDPDDLDEASHDTLQMYDPRRMMQDAEEDDDRPPTFRPRCIHELEDPSYIRALGASSRDLVSEDEQDGDPYAPPTPTPRRVRLSGWIEPVDVDAELAAFSASRSKSGMDASMRSRPSSSRARLIPSPPSPPPSPSPSPSPPRTIASKHAPLSLHHTRTSRQPSPLDTDASFDVSFSTLNNTSTPAKPRPRTRPALSQTNTSTGSKGRSPSYTPSPPSFSMPGHSSRSSVTTLTPTLGTTVQTKMTSPLLGSTARTNTLLTERARLLTELAALKRARSISGGGTRGRVGVGA